MIRVTLADDHAVVRAGIHQFLIQTGQIEVIGEFEDGKTALEGVLSLQPDVAILDIQMPAMTGIEVTRALRTNGSRVGILVLTAYEDIPYVQAVLKAGANGFVLKTSSPDEMTRAVMDVYQGKQVLDASIEKRMEVVYSPSKMQRSENTLSARESEILGLVSRGLTNKAISVELEISEKTVQNHIANIFHSLAATSRTDAVVKAFQMGLLKASS